jgi:hypothetical protein
VTFSNDLLLNRPANEKVARLADQLTGNQAAFADGRLFDRLSQLMCWDAALFCAWTAKSVEVPSIEANPSASLYTAINAARYSHVFQLNRTVTTAHQLLVLPPGCLVGFIGPAQGNQQRPLRHMMIHIRNGQGAGNKNSCIFSAGSQYGWERIDMGAFFFTDAAANAGTTMVYTPITGNQTFV